MRTRTLCTLLLALAAGSLVAAQTRPPSPSPNLWIGVLFQDRTLEPVAALVNGKWWLDDAAAAPEQHFEIVERSGRVPPEWLPLGTRLPTDWSVHLLNGGTVPTRTRGPLQKERVFDEHVRLATNIPRRSDNRDDDPDVDEWEALGVATSGTVDVRPFRPETGRTREEALRVLEPAMLDAERAAVIGQQRARDEMSVHFAGITARMIGAAPREVEYALASAQADRSVVFYVEGGKTYGETTDCGTRVSAIATRNRAGTWKVVDVHAQTYCDLYVAYQPLAILERGGARCRLTENHYEDGVDFSLTRVESLSFDEESSNCRLK